MTGWTLPAAALIVMSARNGGAIEGGAVYVLILSALGFLGVERLGSFRAGLRSLTVCPGCGTTNRPKAKQCVWCTLPLDPPTSDANQSEPSRASWLERRVR